jgi:glutamyl-tRNA synthetase
MTSIIMNQKVRVRFAPSPTGPLHIGGVRTALYNYLYTKQKGGDFILRIEDTDSARFVPSAEEYIQETFDWLGLTFDESPSKGGEYGPYRQSERKEIYKKYVNQLLDKGAAYIAFDTPEELDSKRSEISNFQYDASTRNLMRNSLTLSEEETDALISAGTQYVVRIKIEPGIDITVNDMIRGKVVINSSVLDDKVIYKSADELPTYHLANVVDDHLMKITHVIRGEEWLPSAPLHVWLYQSLEWEDTMPSFAHLPLLLKPDGKGKLSKRDGDRLGFPVFPLEWKDPQTSEISSGYREKGYLHEAIINFLAFLGWNPGTEQEIFSLEELVEAFSFERCSKSGAKFDIEKAKWYNHQYIARMPDEEHPKQHFRIDSGASVILTVQRRAERIDEAEINSPVHLPQQMVLRNYLLQNNQIDLLLLFPSFLQHLRHRPSCFSIIYIRQKRRISFWIFELFQYFLLSLLKSIP